MCIIVSKYHISQSISHLTVNILPSHSQYPPISQSVSHLTVNITSHSQYHISQSISSHLTVNILPSHSQYPPISQSISHLTVNITSHSQYPPISQSISHLTVSITSHSQYHISQSISHLTVNILPSPSAMRFHHKNFDNTTSMIHDMCKGNSNTITLDLIMQNHVPMSLQILIFFFKSKFL
jgi:hypothetical protein